MASAIAGIVSYNPDTRLVALCSQLLSQGVPVVIADNASREGREHLTGCESLGAHVLSLPANEGLAAALNHLLKTVSGESAWMFTFDQDSAITDDYAGLLLESARRCGPDVAMIGPLVRDHLSGLVQQGSIGSRNGLSPARRLITSGSLNRVSALRSVDGFSDGLFIDMVDFDLCLRLRRASWRLMLEPRAVLEHSIGAGTLHAVGPWQVRTSHHGPDRLFYRYRNFLLLARRGLLRDERRWALRTAAALAWGPAKVAMLEQDRGTKLLAILAGVRDGVLGRSGARPTSGSLPMSDGVTPWRR